MSIDTERFRTALLEERERVEKALANLRDDHPGSLDDEVEEVAATPDNHLAEIGDGDARPRDRLHARRELGRGAHPDRRGAEADRGGHVRHVRELRASRSRRSGSRPTRGRRSASTASARPSGGDPELARSGALSESARPLDVRVGSATDGLTPLSFAERSLAASSGAVAGARRDRARGDCRRPADEAPRHGEPAPRRGRARARPVLDPPRAQLRDRVRPLRERDRDRDRPHRHRGRLDARLLRPLRRPASGAAGRARARDRRQRLEPARPRPARLRHRLPRLPLLAGVQPRRQLHRRRRRHPRSRRSRSATASRAGRAAAVDAAPRRRRRRGRRGSTATSPACPRSARARRPSGCSRRAACSSTARARPKSHQLAGGEELEFEPPAPPPAGSSPEPLDLRHRLRGRAPARRRQARRASSSIPRPATRRGTLVHGLLAAGAEGGDEERPGIVHRLDRDTSGLLVVARSEEAHERLQGLLRAPRADARVPRARRRPPALAARHDRGADRPRPPRPAPPLARHRHAARGGHALRGRGAAATATRSCASGSRPGRTHQIRVHLAAIDLPVAGDPLYGQPGRPRPRAPVPPRGAARLPAPVRRASRSTSLAAAGRPRGGPRAGARLVVGGFGGIPLSPRNTLDVARQRPRSRR